MGIYDFEVLKDGAIIAAEQTIALPDTGAAWPKIAELAKTFDEPGHKIRVKDEAGGIVKWTRFLGPGVKLESGRSV